MLVTGWEGSVWELAPEGSRARGGGHPRGYGAPGHGDAGCDWPPELGCGAAGGGAGRRAGGGAQVLLIHKEERSRPPRPLTRRPRRYNSSSRGSSSPRHAAATTLAVSPRSPPEDRDRHSPLKKKTTKTRQDKRQK